MSKKSLILLFIIITIMAGAVYVLNLTTAEPVLTPEDTVRKFFAAVNTHNLEEASDYLADGSDPIQQPGNALGRAIHENLKVIIVENVMDMGNSDFIADISLETLDVRQIMSRAMMQLLVRQQGEIQNELKDEDQILSEIYDTILAGESLPKKEEFCILKMQRKGDNLKIIPDDSLQKILEGNLTESLEFIDSLINKE